MGFELRAEGSSVSSVGECVTVSSCSLSEKRVTGDTRSGERTGPSLLMSNGERGSGSVLCVDGRASRVMKSSNGGILGGEAGSRSNRKVT